MKHLKKFNEAKKDKTKPLFKSGERCVLILPIGKDKIDSILDDKMVIDGEPSWRNGQWWYDIVGKANPSEEKILRLYSKEIIEKYS
jgi:hypothetical protein